MKAGRRIAALATCAAGALLALLLVAGDSGAQVKLGPQGGTITRVTAGSGLSGGGSGGPVTVSLGACPSGETQVSTGSGYACAAVGGGGGGGGDLTAVNGGSGVVITNGTGPIPTVDLDATYWQRAVTACGAGSAVNDIADDGTPTCIAVGDVTDVIAGTGISVTNPGGPQPTVTANLAGASCSAGQYVSAIGSTGAGTCTAEVGDISAVNAGTGLSVTGSTGPTPTINLNLAGASCTAGSFVSAISSTGTGTCTAASGGISGLTTGVIPKAASSTTLDDSIMSQSGSVITFAGSQVTTGNTQTSFIGVGTTPDANMGVKVNQSAIQYGYVAVGPYSGFSTGNVGGFVPDLQGTVDTTAASRTVAGVNSSVTTTRSAGANDLINAAVVANASGAQQNYSFLSTTGGFSNAGAGSFGSSLVVGTTLGVGTDLTVNAVSLLIGNVNAEANVQLDNAGDITFDSTGTAGASVDVGIGRYLAGALIINDGDGVTLGDTRDLVARSVTAGNAGVAFKMISTGRVEWGATTLLGGATDIAFGRNTAGVAEVNSGVAGTLRDVVARTWYGSNGSAGAFKAISTSQFEFSSTTAYNGATDVALRRNAAGVIEVNSGTSATYRDVVARTHFGGTAAGTSFKSPSTGRIEWSSTTAHTGASDVGLERSAAGVLYINDGAGVLLADQRDLVLRNFTSSGNLVLGDASADTIALNGVTTAAATFNSKGFLVDDSASASVTSCGTGPTVTSGKNGFTVTPGTGSFTTCTVTFGSTFTAAPSCVLSFRDQTKAAAVVYTTSTSAFSITSAAASINGAVFDVVCIGH